MGDQQSVTPSVDMPAMPPAMPMTGDDVASEATVISKSNLDIMPTLASEPSEPEVAELAPEMPVADPLPMPESDMLDASATQMQESDMPEPVVAPAGEASVTAPTMEYVATTETATQPEAVASTDSSETPQV